MKIKINKMRNSKVANRYVKLAEGEEYKLIGGTV